MPKVLIISPHFPPINAPDHQRIRQLLPFVGQQGWQATILAATPESSDLSSDELLSRNLPTAAEIIRIPAWSSDLCGKIGLRNLGWRVCWPFYKACVDLLQRDKFDLLYFSNTMFATWLLAPLLKRKFAVPYVVDFQDPWVVHRREARVQPGKIYKRIFARTVACLGEPWVVKKAAGITAVSPSYLKALKTAYPELQEQNLLHLPFSFNQSDFQIVSEAAVKNPFFQSHVERVNCAYVGRLGPDMVPALETFFTALAGLKKNNPALIQKFRFFFIGSHYHSANQQPQFAIEVASRFGFSSQVQEFRERVAYFTALKVIQDSQLNLLFDSAATDYSPSKLYPLLAAGRPILAITQPDSTLDRLVRQAPEQIQTLQGSTLQQINGLQEYLQGISTEGYQPKPLSETDSSLLDYLSAESMTKKLCGFFNKVCQA